MWRSYKMLARWQPLNTHEQQKERKETTTKGTEEENSEHTESEKRQLNSATTIHVSVLPEDGVPLFFAVPHPHVLVSVSPHAGPNRVGQRALVER
mmetsp:Transcript_14965/g.25400  ORF Transcript_14965/g.25400 Transcript_14965/m.25400 type:complete len:95 (-) Transcript_14965:468-752(-)